MYTSAAAIGGILVWGFRHRIVPKQDFDEFNSKEKSTEKILSGEDNLNRLIREIEYFVKKWMKSTLLKVCYRREIELRTMWHNRFKIRKHATTIRKSNKSLKIALDESQVMIHNDLFDTIDKNVDRMIDLVLNWNQYLILRKRLHRQNLANGCFTFRR